MYESFRKPDATFFGQNLNKLELDGAFNSGVILGKHLKYIPIEYQQNNPISTIHCFYDRECEHFSSLIPKHKDSLQFEPKNKY